MSHDRRGHWERIHESEAPQSRSWFQPRPETSLALIERAAGGRPRRVIDVGGGSSRLVDELLEQGTIEVTVLDISASAIEEAKRRLGARAERAQWIVGDVTEVARPGRFDIWHDRAVFHFLTEAEDRRAYVRLLEASLEVGGHAIIATFAEDGPERCSGLPVVRYSPESLEAELGDRFALMGTQRERHITPSGKQQSFVYCSFDKVR